jgi:thymidylate synthase (FAD)
MKIVQAQVIPITPLNGQAILKRIEEIARTCYRSEDKITADGESAKKIVRALSQAGHGAMLEHATISMRYVSNIAAYKDLTRHRHGSYAIESTRWCNYNKGKFGSEIKFLDPIEIPKDSLKYQVWLNSMEQAEQNYMTLANMGAKPDELSLVLPQSTAAEFVITANLREWNHIFGLRAVGHSRPCIKQIMEPTLEMFHKEIPIVFDDVYNKMLQERQRGK